ncbi:unnamed protein product [Paramecium octaurelia]|uniref:Uncharacterized protein n=1 Tax=Paramecium octaurelia TaxID=43137 RepID=A0A8S1SRI7_PAROT|nr:unnamed protein product [Paramecium octaurelia]
MHFQYEENAKRSLICRGCAGRTLGQDSNKCCCQENKFVNVLKNHYVEGNNINQLSEMLDLAQGTENFCEEHGYLYEFIITKNPLENGQSKFDNQELYCKMCIEKNQENLHCYKIELLNDEYFKVKEQNKQTLQQVQQQEDGQQDKKELQNKIKEVFEKMKIALQNDQLLEQKKNVANKRKEKIQEAVNKQANQNQIIQNEDQEQRDNKISQLDMLKKALDLRMKAIAYLDNGYHDYLHDDYLEGESTRKKIMEEENPMKVDEYGNYQQKEFEPNKFYGYPIIEAFKYFDDIQFI